MTGRKIHLLRELDAKGNSITSCGAIIGVWLTEFVETIDLSIVNCKSCEGTDQYKAIDALDAEVAEIMYIKDESIEAFKAKSDCSTCDNASGDDCKVTGRLEFTESGDCMDHKERAPSLTKQVYSPHYKTGGIQTVDKIDEVMMHLEKSDNINFRQAGHIYNLLKYWDRAESKDQYERDIYKTADSIHRAITGKFLNEVGG
jgi:hypothetical protein